MLKLLKFFIIVSLLIGIAIGGFFFWAQNYYITPNKLNDQVVVLIEKGDGLRIIARKLEHVNAIEHPEVFLLAAKYTGQTNLKQGEYLFPAASTPEQILRKLSMGDVVIRRFTIPEGKTSYEVAQILKTADGLKGEIPLIPEGTILPSTYYYHYGDTYESVIKQMQFEMNKTINELWPQRNPLIPINTPEEAIILASIVEKETGVTGERGLVASVFINRLKKSMRLESDPTAVYGITNGKPLGRVPLRADVQNNNPYNTYIIPALPPAPIANPGRESIKAVLNPPETEYLFFVATGNGGHNFSVNLKEHNNNVNKYRQAMAALR